MVSSSGFEHKYQGCDLIYGRGVILELNEYLDDSGLERGMIICGSHVGKNKVLMNYIDRGMGERFSYVFDRTTPEKRVETVFDAIAEIETRDIDVLIGVGGGSSLDIARQTSVFAEDGRTLSELRTEAEDGHVRPPETEADEQLPVLIVPTTFAGADVSSGGSVELFSPSESPTNQPVRVSGTAMPVADFVDPALFETTPVGALAGSAMNGFNKGIETPYARDTNPISDASAVHGLRFMSESFPILFGDTQRDGTKAMDNAVVGSLLVQLHGKSSLIHAFGHGLSHRYNLQQGNVHAVIVPHVLGYLLEQIDRGRTLLALGLGITPNGRSSNTLVEEILDKIIEVRDSLGTPTLLRELPGTRKQDLPSIAEMILEDHLIPRAPVKPNLEDIERVLNEAW